MRVVLDVPTMGNWEMESFEFRSVWNDPRNSFISITNNQHYFKTADGHVYFPVGLNINEGTFGCGCAENVNDVWGDEMNATDCNTCYGEFNPAFNSSNQSDPCCGIRQNKRKDGGAISKEPILDENGQEVYDSGRLVQSYTLAPAAYVKLEHVLRTLQEKGGNSFRTLNDPAQYDIEFEKLNNYYDRQYQAWEFDNIINTCNELDLRMEWNMLIHYAIEYHPFGYDKFDWDNTQNCEPCPGDDSSTGTNGYCYWNELDLNTPVDFLTDTDAILNYKKKLRYMIARWGYSKNIFVMELVSEMNNIGKSKFTQYNDVDGDGVGESWWNDSNGILDDGPLGNGSESPPETGVEVEIPSPYNTEPEIVRPAVAAWHHEMARYIKEELHHSRHLIAADYTGKAPMIDTTNILAENPCASNHFDNSWQSPFIDAVAYNNYSAHRGKFEAMTNEFGWIESLLNGGSDDVHPGFLCNEQMNTEIISFQNMSKPVINPETGFARMSCDNTGFMREIVTIPFTGHATGGMSWDEWSSAEHWHWYSRVRNFLDNQLFDAIDIGNEEWIPGYQESSNGDAFGRTEAVYLKDDTHDHKKLVGVIMNRTWNWFTIGVGGSCDVIPMDPNQPLEIYNDELPTVHHNLMILGDSDEPIRIKDMDMARRYKIVYYDPFDLTIINEETVNTVDQRLRLENYPLLIGNRQFVFFKAWRDPIGGDEESFSPTMENGDLSDISVKQKTVNTSEIETFALSNLESDNLESTFIYPNPTSAKLRISRNSNSFLCLIILDATGLEVMRINEFRTHQELDLGSLANGIYLMRIHETSETFHIIKNE